MYSQLGHIEHRKGMYSAALQFYHKALDIYVKSLPPTHHELATTYNNIGSTHYRMGEYSAALEYHRKALDITSRIFASHSTLFGHQVTTRLVVCMTSMGEYSKALENHHKALDIRVESLPPAHPDLATASTRLVMCMPAWENTRKHSNIITKHSTSRSNLYLPLILIWPPLTTRLVVCMTAWESIRKHSNIITKHSTFVSNLSLPLILNLATTYNKYWWCAWQHGRVFESARILSERISTSMSQISPSHSYWFGRHSYSNIGDVYNRMGEYSKALEHHQKDLDIMSQISSSHSSWFGRHIQQYWWCVCQHGRILESTRISSQRTGHMS